MVLLQVYIAVYGAVWYTFRLHTNIHAYVHSHKEIYIYTSCIYIHQYIHKHMFIILSIYNHVRLHRILQNSIWQLNWKKNHIEYLGFEGRFFHLEHSLCPHVLSNFLLSIDCFFICPREGSGNSWQEEMKDKTKKHFSSYFLSCKTFQKINFLGFTRVPPHAGNAKTQYSMYVAFTCVWNHCIWQYHWATNT